VKFLAATLELNVNELAGMLYGRLNAACWRCSLCISYNFCINVSKLFASDSWISEEEMRSGWLKPGNVEEGSEPDVLQWKPTSIREHLKSVNEGALWRVLSSLWLKITIK
jgi:hypothetical protein